MAGQVTIERREGGELVARKRPVDASDVAGLRREAAVLAVVQGNGVVELLDVLDDGADGGPVIELAHVGGSLETGGAVDATTAVRLVAQTAAALSRGHALGISHGRIDPSHVLRDATGAAVVCGWGHGGARPDVADVPSGQPFDPAGDVAMVGGLLTSLLSGASAATGRRARGRARSEQRLRTKAGALATAAAHPNVELRPSMAELAQRLGDLVPAPTPANQSPAAVDVRAHGRTGAAGPTPAPEADTPGPWSALTGWLASVRVATGLDGRRRLVSPHVLAVAGVAAVAAVVTVVGMAPFGAGSPPRTETAQAAPAGGTGSEAVQPTEVDGDLALGGPEPSTTAVIAVSPVCPATAEELASTGLPAGCADAVVVSGREVRLGSMRYVLGEDGDQVALADLRCDGLARPALLRPATGDLYVFEGWASAGADTSGRLVGRFPGAAGIEAAQDGPCGRLAVVAVDGSRSVLTGEELR